MLQCDHIENLDFKCGLCMLYLWLFMVEVWLLNILLRVIICIHKSVTN